MSAHLNRTPVPHISLIVAIVSGVAALLMATLALTLVSAGI